MDKKYVFPHVVFLLILSLFLSGCADEQFAYTAAYAPTVREEVEPPKDLFAEKTVEQDMFDPALAAQSDETASMLAPGCLVVVNILELQELVNTEARVNADGYISLPVLGQVDVLNLTPAEAEKKIGQLLREQSPQDYHVSVFIKEDVSEPITLVGAFNAPGSYEHVAGDHLLDIIATAQGVADNAALLAYLLRPDETTGQRRAYIIDLDALTRQGDMKYNIPMAGGDVLFIPEAGQYVVDGAVGDPGAYPVYGGTTIPEALRLAGGLTTDFMENDSVKLMRYAGDGKRETISFTLNDLQEGQGDGLALKDQDIIYVESRSAGLSPGGLGFNPAVMRTQ
ncbi:MAG: polysaccharide biosynthesis/export family protein [Candidatus Electrothrix sp. YB6]